MEFKQKHKKQREMFITEGLFLIIPYFFLLIMQRTECTCFDVEGKSLIQFPENCWE